MGKLIPLVALILIFVSFVAWATTEDKSLEAMEWYGKGIRARKAMNYDMAIKCFNKSIDIFSKIGPMLDKEFPENIIENILHSHSDAHTSLGMIYQERGMLRKAVSEYKKAVAIYPHSVSSHFNLGCCYDKLGKQKEAIYEYKSALDNSIYAGDSDYKFIYSQAHYNLGLIHKKSQPALSADHLYKAGLLFLEQGDIDSALEAYNSLKEIKEELARELYEELSPKLKKKKGEPAK